MARTYQIFGDIEGKLDALHVECTKMRPEGPLSPSQLIAKHGRRGNMSKWVSDLKGDCPKRDKQRDARFIGDDRFADPVRLRAVSAKPLALV